MKLSPLNGIIAAAGAIVFTSAVMFVLTPQSASPPSAPSLVHPTSPPTVSPKPPAVGKAENWELYRNEKWGFEIKYPDEFIRIRDASKEGLYQSFSFSPGAVVFNEDVLCLQSTNPSKSSEDQPCTMEFSGNFLYGKTLEQWLAETEGVKDLTYEQWIRELNGKYEWQKIGENDWLYAESPEGPGGSVAYFSAGQKQSVIITVSLAAAREPIFD